MDISGTRRTHRMEALGHHNAHAPRVEGRDEGGLGVAAVVLDAFEGRQSHALKALHHQHPLRAQLLVYLSLQIKTARLKNEDKNKQQQNKAHAGARKRKSELVAEHGTQENTTLTMKCFSASAPTFCPAIPVLDQAQGRTNFKHAIFPT